MWFVSVVALAVVAQADRPRVLDPGVALESLGGLAEPLKAEGWTLTPMRGSTIEPGDIVDPADNQVQITGRDCFGEAAVRRGQGVSASVNQALEVAGKARGGLVSAKAAASKSVDVGISGAEIAEIPVGSLRPSESCVTQLQVLASQGYDVNRFQVIQSVLFAELTLASCLGGSAEVRAPGAGGSVSASDCRGIQATRAGLAVRTEIAKTALANAGVDITGPPPRVGLEDPDRKRKKKEAPPCWLFAACDPYPATEYVSTTGKGPSMAAADADARRRLMDPFEVRFRGLASTVGGGESGEAAAKAARKRVEQAVQIAARHQDGLVYYSLASIERRPFATELEQRISGEESRLSGSGDGAAVEAASKACEALAATRELVFLHAQLSALKMVPSRPAMSLGDAEKACIAAKSSITVGVPDDRMGELLAAGLSVMGIVTVPLDDESATVRVLLDAKSSQREISGVTNVTWEGTLELLGGFGTPVTLSVRGSGASKDAERAEQTALADLHAAAASAVVKKFEEQVP